MTESQAGDALGPWLDFSAAAARLGLGLAGMSNLSAVVDAVAALLGYQDSELQLLKSIKLEVGLLRREPFVSARENIATACDLGPSAAAFDSYLREAEQLLIKAQNLAASLPERALVEFYRSLVCLALRNAKTAARLAEASAATATLALDALFARARGGVRVYPKVVDGRPDATTPRHSRAWVEATGAVEVIALPALNIVPILGPRAGYAALSRRRRQQVAAIEDLLPLYNTARAWQARLAGKRPPEQIVLRELYGGVSQREQDPIYKDTKYYGTYFVLTTASDTSYRDRLHQLP